MQASFVRPTTEPSEGRTLTLLPAGEDGKPIRTLSVEAVEFLPRIEMPRTRGEERQNQN